MFRKMRRYKQQMENDEAVEILKNGTSGVLALLGDDGYPYAVPMSYVYSDNKLYFHSALTGHKTDAIRKYGKASFCVIARDDIVAETFTTHYESVIAFGKVRVLENPDETLQAIRILSDKYCPVDVNLREKEIAGSVKNLCMIELTIEHITGKKAKELL